MHREFIATRQALALYLRDLAWNRYRVQLPAEPLAPQDRRERLTQHQVRRAVAELESRLRWKETGRPGDGTGEGKAISTR